MLDIHNAIWKITNYHDLSATEMNKVMRAILSGQATSAQIAAIVTGLAMKGESVTELTTAVSVLREYTTQLRIHGTPIVDIVGTGGDKAKTFNISTVVSFVVAAAGGLVAKHCNRAFSSQSGSADVLEAAGVNIHLSPEQTTACVQELGIGILFAPALNLAMQKVQAPRKELGTRTLFNLIGPLANPASAKHHLIGVYAQKWLLPFAEVLQRLGSKHALIVHAEDGLDEISIASKTHVVELKEDALHSFTLNPKDFGFKTQALSKIQVDDKHSSLKFIEQVLQNKPSAARDIVVLNAGAAIYAADLSVDLASGIETAMSVIQSGAALAKFNDLIHLSQEFPREYC